MLRVLFGSRPYVAFWYLANDKSLVPTPEVFDSDRFLEYLSCCAGIEVSLQGFDLSKFIAISPDCVHVYPGDPDADRDVPLIQALYTIASVMYKNRPAIK